uniref:Uncharacterized protein n=1 Tax=Glossina austeni TaxID=7395 RepID=A0A1A9UF12_GLOAU
MEWKEEKHQVKFEKFVFKTAQWFAHNKQNKHLSINNHNKNNTNAVNESNLMQRAKPLIPVNNAIDDKTADTGTEIANAISTPNTCAIYNHPIHVYNANNSINSKNRMQQIENLHSPTTTNSHTNPNAFTNNSTPSELVIITTTTTTTTIKTTITTTTASPPPSSTSTISSAHMHMHTMQNRLQIQNQNISSSLEIILSPLIKNARRRLV